MKKAIFTLLLSIITCLATAQWNWVNPKPTGYVLFDVDFINETTGYVIGEKGTLLKTVDAGESWEFIPTGTFADFQFVCFTTETVGYASTIDAHMLKTTDGGFSWQMLETDTLERIYDIFFLNEYTGFIAADHGNLLRTTDGGITWDRAFINLYMEITSIYFVNDFVGFATSRLGRYYQTIDGGDTWDSHTDPTMMDLNDVYFVDASHGFIAGDDGFFMRTVNGGISWTSMNCYSEVREMKFIDETTGFAIASEFLGTGHLVKTTNAGSSWFPVGMDDIESYAFVDDNTVIGTGGMGRLLKSTNAGVTSSNYTSSVTYADFVDIHFPSTATGYAIGYMGEIVKTDDAGENWQLLPQGPAQRLNGVWFTSNTNGFVSGDSSLYTTADGGITWSKLPIVFPGWMTEIFFVNSEIGYLIGEGDGLIYKTTDGGTSWNLLYQDELHWPRSIYFVNPDTGYVALGTSILKTSNGGIDWTETVLSNTEYVLLLSIFFPTADVGYAGGFGGKIYKTTDGGNTWNEQIFSETSYHTIISIWFIDQYKGFLGGDGSGFFQTADGGNSWTKLEYMTGFHDAIWFTNSSTGYLAGSYGKIMKTSNAGAVPATALEKPGSAYTLYPNPAMYEITLSANHNINSMHPAQVMLFNSSGALISSHEIVNPKIRLDISKLSPGIYYLRIKTASQIETKKLVKM